MTVRCKKGDRVAIFNNRYPTGEPFIEGYATIQSRRLGGDDEGGAYKVHFNNDHPDARFDRYVIYAAQSEPMTYLAELLSAWAT